MLVAARDAGVRRLVFAGSSSVYGDTPTLPKHEDMPTNPLSPYALQKLVGEQYRRCSRASTGSRRSRRATSTCSGRGRIRGSPYSGVISLFIKALLEGTQPVIYGDGEQTRDFTYVANVVDGVLRAAETPGVGGRDVQRRDQRPHLAQRAAGDVEEDLRVRASQPIYKDARAGDVRDSQADITKAQQMLGYRPTVGLEEGLRETVAWFQSAASATPQLDAASGTRPSS